MTTREDFCSYEALEGHCAPLSALSGVTTGDVAEAISSASDLIWALTGRQFGAYTETVRPDLRGEASSVFDLNRFPVTGIVDVKIDGESLPTSAYWVSDGRALNRTDGASWPLTQKLYLDDTEAETFSVTLTWGTAPPPGVQAAARRLACELLSLKFGGNSNLPDRVRSTVRQGISMEHVSAEDLLNNGRTGIFEIDLVLSTYNRDETAALPAVMSPDINWYDHAGTTTVGAAPGAVGGVSEDFVLTAISEATSGLSAGGGVTEQQMLTAITAATSGISANSRTPTGGAGGALSGDYPNPGLNTESVQELVAGFLAAGEGVVVTYDDAGNALTIAATGTANHVVDHIGAFGPGFDTLAAADFPPIGTLPWGAGYYFTVNAAGVPSTTQMAEGQTILCTSYLDGSFAEVPENEAIWTYTGGEFVINPTQPAIGDFVQLTDGEALLGIEGKGAMLQRSSNGWEAPNTQTLRGYIAHTTNVLLVTADGVDDSGVGTPTGTVVCDATAGAIVRDLPSLANTFGQVTRGREIVHVKTDASANTVTVTAPDQTIVPFGDVVLSEQGDWCRHIYEGDDVWVTVGTASTGAVGDVVGPASATDGAVALFDGTTGKLLKSGAVLGSASQASSGSFATAAQGGKADTALQPTIVDADSDLIVGTAADTVGRLAVPASTMVGRKASGSIAALTATEVRSELGLGAAATASTLQPFYGTGVDGDATISGSTTLTSDMHYNNLTVSGTLITNGYRVFVAGTLSGAGTIHCNGAAGAGLSGGNGGGSSSAPLIGGVAGGVGATGAGVVAAAGAVNQLGGSGGAGGAGSSAGSTAGRAAAPPIESAGGIRVIYDPYQLREARTAGSSTVRLAGGAGGSGGSGDGTAQGGGGGGGAGICMVFARTCDFTGSIAANGGAGATRLSGNVGGGGGGGGGFAALITASTSVGCSVGASGGAAGNGVGTGLAGANGSPGNFVMLTGVL